MNTNLPSKIAIYNDSPITLYRIQQLATELALPVVNEFTNQYNFLLYIDNNILSLQYTHKNTKPIVVDFYSSKLNFRRLHGGGKKQALCKAIGLKDNPSILDTTAGLGSDAFILASQGLQVTLLEKNPIIAALLEDGLNRGRKIPEISDIIAHMHLVKMNTIDYLQQLSPNEKPDVIYCDPMFPTQKKSALSKKEMQYLQLLLNDESDDTEELLEISLRHAKKRVVVKRPRLASFISNLKPDFQYLGKSCRFDVWTSGVKSHFRTVS